MVAQGYDQVEGIDFDETFSLVARLKSIQLLMALAFTFNFKLFQMEVKSAFLTSYLNEEVHFTQLKGFEDPIRPNYVFKLRKALYGLKQALRAWYKRLTEYLVRKGYSRRGVDQTLFTKRSNPDLIVTQICVDDSLWSYITAIGGSLCAPHEY